MNWIECEAVNKAKFLEMAIFGDKTELSSYRV